MAAGIKNEWIWEITKLIKLIEESVEIIVAIGGPKTIQQIKAKNKSFNRTRMVLCNLLSELSFCPMKFMK